MKEVSEDKLTSIIEEVINEYVKNNQIFCLTNMAKEEQ